VAHAVGSALHYRLNPKPLVVIALKTHHII